MSARRLWRNPLLHFLVLGALLYAAVQARPAAPEPIVFDAAEVAALRDTWTRETGRAPSSGELQASLRRHADEEMLVREALSAGLAERDPVVRERLLRNVAFLFPDHTLRPAQALQFARELGMARADVVVRRRLVQLVEARLAETAALAPGADPSRETIERRAIEQRWFAGADAEHRARTALEALRAGQPTEGGDAFLLGARFAPLTPAQLAQRFGVSFAQAVMQVSQIGEWTGPVASPYGLHLLKVERIETSPAPAEHPYRVLAAREAQALRDGLSKLRESYPLQLARVEP